MFKYPLDKVIKLKRIDENRSLEHLNECRQACSRCDSEIVELLDAYDNTSAGQACEDGLSGMEYLVTANHLTLLSRRIKQLFQEREQLQDALEESIADTQEKVRQRQAHESLKERALQIWKREKRRVDRGMMDEVGQVLGQIKAKEVCGE